MKSVRRWLMAINRVSVVLAAAGCVLVVGAYAATYQEQEQEFQRRRIERLEKERDADKQQAQTRAEAQQVKERCITARNNLEGLQKDRPVYTLDEKGERRFLDDKTRAAEVVRAKKEISTYCKS